MDTSVKMMGLLRMFWKSRMTVSGPTRATVSLVTSATRPRLSSRHSCPTMLITVATTPFASAIVPSCS